MPVVPSNLPFANGFSAKLMGMSHWVNQLFGATENRFSDDYAVGTVPLIDERLRPKVAMPQDTIDILTRVNLSNIGLHNAQEVTAESHPELYAAWRTLCQRAGLEQPVPQLIVTESHIVNAFELGDHQMAITTGLLKRLTLREVVGVLAHESGHGRHEHTGVRRSALALFGAAGIVTGNYIGHQGGLGGKLEPVATKLFGKFGQIGERARQFLMPTIEAGAPVRASSLLGYIAYMFVGAQIGATAAAQISVRPTELQADLDGVALSGDGEGLASALQKIQAADTRGPLRRAYNALRSGYPSIETRVKNIHRAMAEIPAQPIVGVMDAPPTIVRAITHADRVQPEAAPAIAR